MCKQIYLKFVFFACNMRRHFTLTTWESMYHSQYVCPVHSPCHTIPNHGVLNNVVHLYSKRWRSVWHQNSWIKFIDVCVYICVKLTSFIHNCWFNRIKTIKYMKRPNGTVWELVWSCWWWCCQLKWSPFFSLLANIDEMLENKRAPTLCVRMHFAFVNGRSALNLTTKIPLCINCDQHASHTKYGFSNVIPFIQ